MNSSSKVQSEVSIKNSFTSITILSKKELILFPTFPNSVCEVVNSQVISSTTAFGNKITT